MDAYDGGRMVKEIRAIRRLMETALLLAVEWMVWRNANFDSEWKKAWVNRIADITRRSETI